MQNQAPDPVPGRRLTEMSTMEREKLITRNVYNSEDGYNSTHPNALATGDAKGKGNAKYLSVFDTDGTGSSVDILGNGEANTGRIGNIKNNLFGKDNPYGSGNIKSGEGYSPTVDRTNA
jgi:hypothetical protein